MSNKNADTPKTILVVDDENDIRIILKSLLEADSYLVTEACDGQEALDTLASNKFDLMILDLVMPRLSGENVLEILGKQRLREMPTIILTAKIEKQIVKRECLEGVSFYVMKPFDNKQIRELVRCLTGKLSESQREEALSNLLK